MPEHELWEGLDLVEMYKVTLITIPPFTANGIIGCILSAGSATYCENEPEERGDLLFLNSFTFITFQIRSIKPRVQNVLDTLETVIIDLSKSYFLSQHWDEAKLGKTFDNRLKIRERKRQLLQLSTTWTYFRREVKELHQWQWQKITLDQLEVENDDNCTSGSLGLPSSPSIEGLDSDASPTPDLIKWDQLHLIALQVIKRPKTISHLCKPTGTLTDWNWLW